MPSVPQTRASLIVRLPNTEDAAAWQEFVALYEPFIYRFACRNGFQDADAHELVQNVFLAVVKAVGRWEPDSRRARFRTWLFKIARNQLLDLIAKRERRHECTSGSTSLVDRLDCHPAPYDVTEQLLVEHRRELFHWVAARVKRSVKETTWRAFWLTSIEQQPIEEAALLLGLSSGAVRIARSRVIARLRDEISELEHEHAL
jgi:RNA polymerase sigma factor (sigma-70 family)